MEKLSFVEWEDLIVQKMEDLGFCTERKEVAKINQSYHGLMIREPGRHLAVSIDLTALYSHWMDSAPDRTDQDGVMFAVRHILKALEDTGGKGPKAISQVLKDYETVKERLFLRVCGWNGNEEYLKDKVYDRFEDMAITYHILLTQDETGTEATAVRQDMLKDWEISKTQLADDALRSAQTLFPLEISNAQEVMWKIWKEQNAVLYEMHGDEFSRSLFAAMYPPIPEEGNQTVVSNSQHMYGAAVLFYPGTMEAIADVIGCDFYILPASIHEVIIMPRKNTGDENDEAAWMTEMVKTVNGDRSAISEADILTDSLYRYSVGRKEFARYMPETGWA